MRILIVGNGGREHALLWKLRRDHPEGEFWVTRPNGGMEEACHAVDLPPTDAGLVADWAEAHAVDLAVVGPEAPLAAGIVDRFRERGMAAFGPSAAAARIEASKAFAKDLMVRAGVPTAEHRTFEEPGEARAWIRQRGAPVVVKASGLAAGKGALVCPTVEEAVEAVDAIMEAGAFGTAGRQVVVEAFMEGEELSIFGITDGRDLVLLLPSQDHKRVGEGDTGPNTGGMGAYAPVSVATPDRIREARERIFLPTLQALEAEGAPFRGVLYAGLMLTAEGLKVVEFNCRFGDPEAQVVLPLLDSSLLDLLHASARGEGLADVDVRWRPGAALTTVMASGGYPDAYEKAKEILLPSPREDVTVFHAGTRRREDGVLETSGGRVLAVTAVARTLAEAARVSREVAGQIEFEGRHFRRDIGWRELERQG